MYYEYGIDKNEKTNIALRKSQINKDPIQLKIFTKRPEYIIGPLLKKDESFYSKGSTENRSTIKDYPIFLYSTCCFKYINTYLRDEKMYEYDKENDWFTPRNFTLNELNSWTWCLHKEITSRTSNVQNGTLTYRGVRNVTLPNSFKVGTIFGFSEFLSTSTDIKISKQFLQLSTNNENDSKIIFFITITNNGVNSHKNYCLDIEDISLSPEQKEILFTTCCFFTVTSIENYPEIKNCIKVSLNSIGIENPILIKLFDSKILDNEELLNREFYYEKLLGWLKCPKNNQLSDIRKINLLYRGSRDGFLARTFHEKCNYKGETFSIIESTTGYIFGGYTKINWDNTEWNGKNGKDNCSRRDGDGDEFVFTLNNPHGFMPTKYNIKDAWKNHSICCDVNLGPIYGCNDIRIEDNCDKNWNSFRFYDFEPGEYCFQYNNGKNRLTFTGEYRYKVKEIEVFQIIRY